MSGQNAGSNESSGMAHARGAAAQALLISFSPDTRSLVAWPLSPKGGTAPTELFDPAGFTNVSGMAAEGSRIAVVGPQGVALTDLAAPVTLTLPDPYGEPRDVAIGRDKTLYVLNENGTIASYAPGSSLPQELSCSYISYPTGLAVDNEGDLFVSNFTGSLAELPVAATSACSQLSLRDYGTSYVGGVTIDPKSDALIVLDNPDKCAGGDEARMTIYSKPYSAQSRTQVRLSTECSFGIKLKADSTYVFVNEQTSPRDILQATFPQGKRSGRYREPLSYGVVPAFATVPNTLPN